MLGAIFANNAAYERVRSFLRPEAFYDPIHGRIYQSIQRRIDAGGIADAVTLKAEFETSGILEEVGGTAYLAQLLTAMVGIINAAEYGRAIFDCWIRRREIEVGENIVNLAFGADDMPDRHAMVRDAWQDIEIAASAAHGGTVLYSHAIGMAIDHADAVYGGRIAPPMSSGIAPIDDAFGGGLMPATLNYLAGLGETGKTTLAFQIAERIADNASAKWLQGGRHGVCPGVLFISYEMTAAQLGARATARLAQVPLRALKRGELSDDIAGRFVDVQRAAEGVPMEIADGEPSTLKRTLGLLRAFCRRRKCVLAVIDSLTKMVANSSADGMIEAYLSATTALERAAKEMDIPILLLVHLPQSVAKRDNPRPRRGDLPYGIHAQATGAVAIWRPILAVSSTPPEKGRMSEESHSKAVDEWHKKRDELRNVSEIIPLKVREDIDGGGGEIARLTFNQQTKEFET